ncbi:MAG: 50S ribosomal protein L25/general stress protein Ctc [Candidatus Microgenomates bacterium]
MSNYSVKASIRTAFGRRVRALRKTGVVPANIFGKKIKSLAIQVEAKSLKDVLKKAGETNLIDIVVEDGKTHPVLVAGYSQDPVSGTLLHVDFHEVDLNVKTTAMVPLKAVGESEAVKSGNVLVLQRNEIEVEALPADLPNEIEVDITVLTEVGSTIHAKDLKLDRSKVTLMVEGDEVIATIQEPAKEELVPAAPVEGEAAATSTDGEVAPKAEEVKKE